MTTTQKMQRKARLKLIKVPAAAPLAEKKSVSEKDLSEMTAEEYLRDYLENTAKPSIEDGGLMAALHYFKDERIIECILLSWKSAEEKYQMGGLASERAAQLGATALVFIVDAWVSKPSIPLIRPSKDPNRTEAITGEIITSDGKVTKAIQIPYTRLGKKILWGREMELDTERYVVNQRIFPAWDAAVAA